MISFDKGQFSKELEPGRIKLTDAFWGCEAELVRKEVLPYQWEILNDRVEDAAPSYCMHNFKAAAKMMQKKKALGAAYREPVYTFRGFESLPEDPSKPKEDAFYGFVFQDSDFSKWIEAVAYSLEQYPDKELEALADGAIDIVCAAQQDNGYLDTYYIINGMDKIFSNLRDHHELYCFGHLAEGALAYYQATGKDKLLKAACRYADLICERFGSGEGQLKGYPGHELAEMALLRLYEHTKQRRYFELAEFFLNERGKQPYYFDIEHPKGDGGLPTNHFYHQSHMPVREQSEAVGHAVRAVYLYSAMADMARLSGDEEMYEACRRLWESIVNEKLYITGGIGATRLGEAFSYPYDLPNDTAYAETCASIGLVFFAYRMLKLAPHARYGDVMELALYNCILSGMSRDGRSFFYVNPLEVSPVACRMDERRSHVKAVRQKWFGCACCPPNLARLLSSLWRYAYSEREDVFFIHLYIGAEIECEISGRAVKLSIESALPREGRLSVKLSCGEAFHHSFAVRKPGWCTGEAVLHIAPDKEIHEKDGYIYVSGEFKDAEELSFEFPMKPWRIAASEKVRETEGRIAFMRGPMVYCAEEADNGANLHRLRVHTDSSIEEIESDEPGWDAVLLETEGVRLHDRGGEEADALYHNYEPAKEEACRIRLIPYYLWANRGEGEMSVYLYTK